MTKERRVQAGTSTHSSEKVKQPGNSEFTVKNSGVAQMLIDPQDTTSGYTHSADPVKVAKGSKKVPTTAAITDAELDGPINLHVPNDADPAAGYLDEGDSLPVIEVAAIEDPSVELDDADDEFLEDDSVEAEFDDEFSDLPAIEEASDDGDDAELEMGEGVEEAPFEAPMPEGETVALLDADEVADDDSGEELQFATIANMVHVIRANRIVASITPASARRAEASDVYLTPQFQDVVCANIEAKGLRKGLVQSGFVLARVKLSASSKSTAKAVTAKVEAGVAKRVATMAAREKAMEQSLAIAAVGINRRFFKDTTNELKANLETELTQLGVRGGQALVRAMFAKYGVSYAKSILTLANKLAAMPEEMRDSYADALDMTDDGEDFGSEVDSELDVDGEDEFVEDDSDFEPIGATTVSASLLHSPSRRGAALLKAGVKTSAALSILNGSQSLV